MATNTVVAEATHVGPANSNVRVTEVNGMIHIIVDPTQNFGPSKSGKMNLMACTSGFRDIPVNSARGNPLRLSLNLGE
jgi:hypothetical protein